MSTPLRFFLRGGGGCTRTKVIIINPIFTAKPGFHMIATIAVVAAIAEKKKGSAIASVSIVNVLHSKDAINSN